MKDLHIDKPQVHDLLEIDPGRLASDCVAEPHWAHDTLIACPWVVVRRARASVGRIAVGVRGSMRSERWGACCEESRVRKIVRPEELLRRCESPDRSLRTPALTALEQTLERWADLTLPWGPIGSVGFELASGHRVTTEQSDLDLVIRAPRRITIQEARSILGRTIGLDAKVDVRVETPVCGFSLDEYATAASARILLRFMDGVRLGDDPWLAAVDVSQVQEAPA